MGFGLSFGLSLSSEEIEALVLSGVGFRESFSGIEAVLGVAGCDVDGADETEGCKSTGDGGEKTHFVVMDELVGFGCVMKARDD